MARAQATPFDAADCLRTPEDRAVYLQAMLDEANGDPYRIVKAIETIGRSVGMAQLARKSGLSRETLEKSLSGDCDPDFEVVYKVMAALGLQFQVVAR